MNNDLTKKIQEIDKKYYQYLAEKLGFEGSPDFSDSSTVNKAREVIRQKGLEDKYLQVLNSWHNASETMLPGKKAMVMVEMFRKIDEGKI